MAYSKTLSAEKMATLAPVISKLNSLREGEEAAYRDSNENLTTLRLWLYNWLWLENRKQEFKIIWKSPELLLIVKKRTAIEPTLVDLNDQEELVDYVCDNLLSCETEEEVIAQMLSDEVASQKRIGFLKEWRRMMGKA